ncbi:hypothetical protein BGZ76_007449 [Entomortierella beljakovae]|nr:hypothetical protein BGZ76_007449 [Entomortierella beljakovae]
MKEHNEEKSGLTSLENETHVQAQPGSKGHSFVIVNQGDDRDAGIYSDNFYSQKMSPLRKALRQRVLLWVRSETNDLASLQDRWRTPFLDSYFTLTAFAGHPLFFVCILPIMFWSKREWSIASKVIATFGLAIYLFSIVFGRLYCGMHTKTDILGGTAIGVLVWAVQWIFRDSIDALMTESSWKVIGTVIFGGIYLILSIPETMDSCPCVDDGVTTLAVIMGIFPASQHFASTKYAVSEGGYNGIVHYDPSLGLPRSFLRFVFGLAIVFTWRIVAKKSLYIVLPPIYRFFNLPSRTHFVPAKTYGNLRSQPIGRVPSVMDISALADSSIEIVGVQSTMDIHEQFSQTRISRNSSSIDYNIETKEHFGLRPSYANKAHQQELRGHEGKESRQLVELDDETNEADLDESERIAMEKFEAEHPGWAHFDVDIVIKTVVYAGIGWLTTDSIPIMFEHIADITIDTNSKPRSQRNRRNSVSSNTYRYHYHQHQGVNEGGLSPSSTSLKSPKRLSYMQTDSVGITVEEYDEILSSEVWIEVPKLREYARHGIPYEIRGRVWVYLLGIRQADRSKEVSSDKQRRLEYEQLDKEPNESLKRVRGEISRYMRKVKVESGRDIPRILEDFVSGYYDQFSETSVNEAVAKFMTLFHTCIPDLYSYFEEEEVDIKEWAASSLRYLLSRELPLECTMRLWDTYFAIPDSGWIGLHPYACLAILKHLKEGFEDLEQSEIRTVLMRLPHLDMDIIINEAYNLRHDILERSDDGF